MLPSQLQRTTIAPASPPSLQALSLSPPRAPKKAPHRFRPPRRHPILPIRVQISARHPINEEAVTSCFRILTVRADSVRKDLAIQLVERLRRDLELLFPPHASLEALSSLLSTDTSLLYPSVELQLAAASSSSKPVEASASTKSPELLRTISRDWLWTPSRPTSATLLTPPPAPTPLATIAPEEEGEVGLLLIMVVVDRERRPATTVFSFSPEL